MRKHLRWLALCAGFGLSACTTTLTPRQATAKACADWHQIAIRSPTAAECPTIPGWTGKKLFDSTLDAERPLPVDQQKGAYSRQLNLGEGQDSSQLSTAELAKELDRFCRYEITDPSKKLSNFLSHRTQTW